MPWIMLNSFIRHWVCFIDMLVWNQYFKIFLHREEGMAAFPYFPKFYKTRQYGSKISKIHLIAFYGVIPLISNGIELVLFHFNKTAQHNSAWLLFFQLLIWQPDKISMSPFKSEGVLTALTKPIFQYFFPK